MARQKSISPTTPPIKPKTESNRHKDYDHVFQKDLDEIWRPLVQKVLGLGALNAINLKNTKIRRTLYREPDVLLAELDEKGGHIRTIHIEIHLKDEIEIGFRAAEYAIMEYREFRKPVKIFIIYIGNGRSVHIPTVLDGGCVQVEIVLIHLNSIPAEVFIHSDYPGEVVLGILGDFGTEKEEVIIRKIILQLQNLIPDQENLQKYCKHLEILSNIRKLQPETIKQLSAMPITYDLKTDLRYQQGREEGLVDGVIKGIKEGHEKGFTEGIKKGIEKGIEKGREEGIEKGIEKGREEGREEGIEKGIEKGREEGIEKGIKKGIEKGIKKGREEGIEKGIEKGREEALIIAIGRVMAKFSHFSDQEIAEIFELSAERISELRALWSERQATGEAQNK